MKRLDLQGKTFGRLTVLSKDPAKSKHGSFWVCQCECGVVKSYVGSNLASGNTTSCGCAHREQLVARNAQQAFQPWLADMLIYKRRVGYRRARSKLGSNQYVPLGPGPQHPSMMLPWALDLDTYTRLVTSPCFYCGASPSQKPHGVVLQRQGFKRNGIDRVDNTRGYEPDNCVPCCATCNRDKRAQTQAEFLAVTRRRYEHLVATGLITK